MVKPLLREEEGGAIKQPPHQTKANKRQQLHLERLHRVDEAEVQKEAEEQEDEDEAKERDSNR